MTKNIFDQYLDIYSLKEIIVRGDDIHVLNACGNNALFYKVDSATVRYLIQQGLDVNHENHKGETPLFHTSFYGMEVLLENGAKINHLDHFGHSALYHTCNEYYQMCNEYYQMRTLVKSTSIRYLIEKGAVPPTIKIYQEFSHFYSDTDRSIFDMFMTMTNNDKDFFQMCLAYQEGVKNHDKIEIKDMDIV